MRFENFQGTRKLVVGLVIFLIALPCISQTVVTVGTVASTSATAGPTTSSTAGDRNERHTCIYSAAELTAAGLSAGRSIMSIAWEKTGVGFYYDPNLTIRIWLKHSSTTIFAASPNFATETGTATLVYQTTTGNIPQATGWLSFPFNTATPFFVWDGVQNLEVITELIRPTDWTDATFAWRTITSVTNAAANANGTIAAPPATLTRTGTRPQVRLGISTTGTDVAVIGIPNPVSGPPGSQNIIAQLRNTGTTTLTSAVISLQINGGLPLVSTWTGSLAPGAVTNFSMGSNNFTIGTYIIDLVATSANGAPDVDPSNNSLSKTIVICNTLTGAYTINKNLPASATNFISFNAFSAALSNCGISGNVTATVSPGSGPYAEQVVFQNIPGIGAGATVTIQGSGETISSAAAINQTGSNPNRHIIRLIGLQYFTINNLHIDMFTGSTGFIGIHILNSGNHITLSNNVVNMGTATSTLLGAFVANGDPAGILTPGGTFDFIDITGNTTTGGGYGASVNGLASPLATNVVIANNSFNDFNSNGVYLRETNGAHVRDNNLDKSQGSVSSANAIQLAQAANINGRIYNNKIKMTQTTGSYVGIYLFNGTGHKVYNNLIYDIRSTTGNIEGIRVRTGSTNPEIYFNTISIDNPVASTGNLIGFREELSNTGSIIRNNIFSLKQSTTGLKHAIELGTLTVPTAINSNYNDFWVPGGNIAYRGTSVTFPTALVIPTLAAWQVASGQDANSFEADPQFQSLINPIPTSGVINNQALPGTGITTDITGATRGAAPDPGAYEFAPPSGDASITNYILPTIPHCGPTLDVKFELTNSGADPLNSVTINWTVNGVPQPVVNWTGPTLSSGNSTIVTLGTIPVAGNTLYTFSATSSLPNGGPDINPGNDTYTYVGFRKGMDGAFTINGSAPASVSNYQSFQTMADDLTRYGVCAAVTITVLNGPYTEQVVFNAIPGTSSTNTVTLNGNGRVLQFNPTVAATDHVLQLNGVNHMIVENLTVNSLHGTQGRGIHITNGASKLTIRNNNVNVSLINSTSISFGIIISGANWLLDGSATDSVVISGNTVTGGYSAIQLSGIHWTSPLTRIRVTNNTVLDWYGFGIYLSYTNNAVVSGNTIRRPTRTNSGSDAVTPAGITIPAGSLGFMIDKNRMYDFHLAMPGSTTISRGVYLSGTGIAPTSGTIQNNLIYGMTNDGAQYGIQDNSVNGPINIYHNTIVLNSPNGASTSNTNAINMSNSGTQSGTDIKNNVFVVTRGGTGIKRIFDVSAASSVFTSNYNVTYLNAPGGTSSFGQIGSTTYNTLADWQASNHDQNSIHADPQFVNPPAGNFTPGNFFADGTMMGTSSVGVVDDINNVVRGTNPDPGAFEFTPPPCSSANGGTASPGSVFLCTSGSAIITATGYSTGAGSTYQWQISTDNFVANVSDITGQTNPASLSTGTITATRWYRLKVTCPSGTLLAYSNIVMVQVSQQPAITTQPASVTACTGSNVTFTVVATNAVVYQWQKNGVNITGATSASYTINNVTATDAGNFTVIAIGAAPCTSVTSNIAVLTVRPNVVISIQPVNQAVCSGANVTFSVTATGSNLSYQWRKAAVSITGANTASYTITGVTVANAGNYDVVVSGDCGTVTSATATLVVNPGGSWIGVTSTDWNTASNWCGGIPTPTTDVFINAGAPNMPNLSNGAGSARNISIGSGASLIIGAAGTLDIYGDLVNTGTFNASSGNLAFRGSSNQSIAAFTATNATMNGTGGITLTGNAIVNGTLTLTNGNITLGSNSLSHALTSGGSVASHIITNGSGNVIALTISAATVRTVPVGINASSYNPIILTGNTGHATDNFTVNVKQGVFVNGVSGTQYTSHVVDRTWNINEGTAGGSNLTIAFQWNAGQELTGFQRNRSLVMRHNGTNWVNGPVSAASGNDPFVQVLNNVTNFSPFAVRAEELPQPVTGIYPNPASSDLNVVLNMSVDMAVIFSVYDAKGSLVMRTKNTVIAGLSRTTLNIDKLSSGVYILKVSVGPNDEFMVQRFVKGLQ